MRTQPRGVPEDGSPTVEPPEHRSFLGRVISRVISDGSLTKKASLNAAASTAEQVARIIAGLLISPFLLTKLGDYLFGVWQFLQRLIGHCRRGQSGLCTRVGRGIRLSRRIVGRTGRWRRGQGGLCT